MKHIAIFAVAAMISTSAMAADYDNTSVKITAKTEAFHISMKAPETGAQELALGSSTLAPVDLEAKWTRNSGVENYELKAGKSMDLGLTPLYAGASAVYAFGDSYTSDTRTVTVTPHIGASTDVMGIAPYAEVGLAFQATQNEITDFDRNSSYLEVGATYAMNTALDMKVSVSEARDVDFANPGDRQIEVGFTVKF